MRVKSPYQPLNHAWLTLSYLLCWIVIAAVAKLLPHIANVSFIPGLALFIGARLSWRYAVIILFGLLIITDLCFGAIYDYPSFGIWSLFTYSGFLWVLCCGQQLSNYPKLTQYLQYIPLATISYWLWTNLGVWLFSHDYAYSIRGFITCYTLALPFLKNSIFADCVASLAIFGLYSRCRETLLFPFSYTMIL